MNASAERPLVVAAMLIIIAIGLFFDRVVFLACERYLQRKWGR